jgi:hypothetical protein
MGADKITPVDAARIAADFDIDPDALFRELRNYEQWFRARDPRQRVTRHGVGKLKDLRRLLDDRYMPVRALEEFIAFDRLFDFIKTTSAVPLGQRSKAAPLELLVGQELLWAWIQLTGEREPKPYSKRYAAFVDAVIEALRLDRLKPRTIKRYVGRGGRR